MSDTKSGISIEADEKNGHLSGTGTITIAGDRGAIVPAFTVQDNGKTKVSLKFNDDFEVAAGGDLNFEGHGELDPKTGKWSAGASATFTVDQATALQLQAQLDQSGVSGKLNLSIPL